MMLAVGGASLVLASAANFHVSRACGHTNALVEFQVIDDQDGQPVPGAKIDLISDLSGPPEVSAVTGSDGSAEISCKVGSSWYKGPFFQSYQILNFGSSIHIDVDGYQSPDEFFHRGWRHKGKATPVAPPVLIRLKRSPKPQTNSDGGARKLDPPYILISGCTGMRDDR
jgi:hypothetical protein